MNKSNLIISVLVVLFAIGEASSQALVNDFKSLKVIQYNELDRVLSSTELSEQEVKEFDVVKYLLDNHEIPRIQIVAGEIKDNVWHKLRFDSRNSSYEANDYLCSTEIHTIRPYLGLALSSNDDFTGVVINKTLESGNGISKILDVGQTITSFNDLPVSSPCSITMALCATEVGQVVPVEIFENGRTITKYVTIGGQLVKNYSYEVCEALEHSDQLDSRENISTAVEMNVYPNPSKGLIYINFESAKNDPLNIYIQAIDGSIIHSETRDHFSGQLRMQYDLDGLLGGNYLVVIEQAGEVFHQKVMHFK